MRKRTALLIAAAVVLLGIQLVPVDRATSPPTTAEIRGETAGLFQRACFDCHSQRTVWPWYAHIAPVSWFLAHDVKEARAELNFSHWNDYAPSQRVHLASDAADEVEKGGMPLATYRLMHSRARLTREERERVRMWAEEVNRAGGEVNGESGELNTKSDLP